MPAGKEDRLIIEDCISCHHSQACSLLAVIYDMLRIVQAQCPPVSLSISTSVGLLWNLWRRYGRWPVSAAWQSRKPWHKADIGPASGQVPGVKSSPKRTKPGIFTDLQLGRQGGEKAWKLALFCPSDFCVATFAPGQ